MVRSNSGNPFVLHIYIYFGPPPQKKCLFLSVLVSVLLSASVKRFSVSGMGHLKKSGLIFANLCISVLTTISTIFLQALCSQGCPTNSYVKVWLSHNNLWGLFLLRQFISKNIHLFGHDIY